MFLIQLCTVFDTVVAWWSKRCTFLTKNYFQRHITPYVIMDPITLTTTKRFYRALVQRFYRALVNYCWMMLNGHFCTRVKCVWNYAQHLTKCALALVPQSAQHPSKGTFTLLPNNNKHSSTFLIIARWVTGIHSLNQRTISTFVISNLNGLTSLSETWAVLYSCPTIIYLSFIGRSYLSSTQQSTKNDM